LAFNQINLITLKILVLRDIFHHTKSHYAECRYAESHYADCRYAECHYPEFLYAECHYP
jgi:hypothetical protein